MHPDLQPTLENPAVLLKPLQEADFEALFRTASDPRIWEQHPNKDRWQRDVFQNYFQGAMESGHFLIIANWPAVPLEHHHLDDAACLVVGRVTVLAAFKAHLGSTAIGGLRNIYRSFFCALHTGYAGALAAHDPQRLDPGFDDRGLRMGSAWRTTPGEGHFRCPRLALHGSVLLFAVPATHAPLDSVGKLHGARAALVAWRKRRVAVARGAGAAHRLRMARGERNRAEDERRQSVDNGEVTAS